MLHIPHSGILALIFCLALTACTAGGGFSADATDEDGEKIFSDLKELDYTPPKVEYTLGTSDLLSIKVFQADELDQKVRVDPRGNISLALIGDVRAKGLTQSALEKQIANRLGEEYLQDPKVSITIEEFTSQRVTVEGEVAKAGVFPIQGEMTLLQALALAGGPSNLADPAKIVLFRKNGDQMKAYNLNLDDIRSGKNKDPYIRNDDRIIAHRSSSRYWLREVGTLLGPVNILRSLAN